MRYLLFLFLTIPVIPTPWAECQGLSGSSQGVMVQHSCNVHWNSTPTPPNIECNQRLTDTVCNLGPTPVK